MVKFSESDELSAPQYLLFCSPHAVVMLPMYVPLHFPTL